MLAVACTDLLASTRGEIVACKSVRPQPGSATPKDCTVANVALSTPDPSHFWSGPAVGHAAEAPQRSKEVDS